MLARQVKEHQHKGQHPVVAVSIVTAITLLADSMLYIALPIYYKEVGLQSLWEVGILLALNRFIRLPINPIVGKMYEKVHVRYGLLLAIILTIVATVGYSFASGFLMWIVLRCIWGIAWSILRLGGYFTVLSYSENGLLGKNLGIYNGISRLGSLVGMLVGGILVGIIGIKMVAIIFAFATILAIPIVLLAIPRSKVEEEKTEEKSKGIPFLQQSIIKLLITGLILAFFIQGVFTASLSYVIGVHYGVEMELFGMVVGVTAFAGILQAIRWLWEPFLAAYFGKLSDGDRGRLPVFLFCLAICAIGFFLIPFSFPLVIWSFVIVIVMIAFTAITTVFDAIASDVANNTNKIKVMTSYTIAIDMGAALGPFICFFVLDLPFGLYYIYAGGAVLFFSLFIVWLFEKK